jgi:hypothetical protein
VTWHSLTPINGWHSGQTQFGTGAPAWAVRSGVVYLSGSVFQTSGTDQVLATLPAAARPSKTLFITVYTLDDTQGYLVIYPSGQIEAWSSPASNAQGFTSLAGVSYPAPALALHKLALKNGWVSSQGQYTTGDPSYAVSDGVVHLSGSLHQISGTDANFGVLPPAARPAHTMYLAVYTYDGTMGLLEVDQNGHLAAYDGGAQQYTSLAGVSFPVPEAAHKLALDNGWQPAQGTGDPAYSVTNGVVYLSGSVRQPTSGNEILTVLPTGARPKHDLYIKVMVYTPGGVAQAGTVFIAPDGTVQAYSSPASNAEQFTSLAGISFPLGS